MSNANEPAFPISASDSPNHEAYWGLDKREYFAALAMQGMMPHLPATSEADRPRQLAAFAARAVMAADALLAELAKS